MRTIGNVLFGIAAALVTAPALAQGPSFTVTIDPGVRDEPYTGRVYVAVVASPEGSRVREPRRAMHAWVNPPPLFAVDVEGVAPGEPILIDSAALAHPVPLAELAPGRYSVQAVARVNPDGANAGLGAGDLISTVRTIELEQRGDSVALVPMGGDDGLEDGDGPVQPETLNLVVAEVVEERAFEGTDRVRYFEVESPLLSEFHGRPVVMRAGVIVPPGFDERVDETFPVIYSVTGFGGSHFSAFGLARSGMTSSPQGMEAIWVVPDPTCFRGHSVFANSATNGPWGDAFVHDLIPALEAEFGGAGAEHRYATGGSSGGWASLWLQLNYPDAFAGCWSHVPDPVELHSFQTVDVYDGDNFYDYEDGSVRPIGRRGDEVFLNARDFVARETVLGPGGQIHAFEAVWSPRMPDGEPRPLFDRETGEIDPVTAEAWRAYDIADLVRTRWDEIGPKLSGKVHVYAGGMDTFYLELAVPALQEAFAEVGSDAVCEIIPGMVHTAYGPGNDDMLATMAERWSNARARIEDPVPPPQP